MTLAFFNVKNQFKEFSIPGRSRYCFIFNLIPSTSHSGKEQLLLCFQYFSKQLPFREGELLLCLQLLLRHLPFREGAGTALRSPDVMDVPVVVDEPVLFGEVAGEEDSAGLGQVVGVGGEVGDGLAGELDRFGVLKDRRFSR